MPEADYMQVGEALALGVRRDFTFVHPEVLDERCSVEGNSLLLKNPINWERYRVFVIPGSRAISVTSLRKIKGFYDQGGQVIATTRLPDTAAEFGQDVEVRALVAAMFGDGSQAAKPDQTIPAGPKNANGGRAWFIPSPTPEALKSVIDVALPDGDVMIEHALTVKGGNLSYIHKVKDGLAIYLIANSSDQEVDIALRLRGTLAPELWDPHDGKTGSIDYEHADGKSGTITRVRLKLPPAHCVFLVAADTANK